MLHLPPVFIGISSVLLQIIWLRQFLSTFSGNELVIGLTLATWLGLVSLGSALGAKVKFREAFGVSFLVIALTSQPSFLLIESIRPLLQFEVGEVVPLRTTLLWMIITMSVPCVTVGIQFPLAVSFLRGKAPEVYSLEAVGAFTGGALFTFFLAGAVDSYKLVTIAAVVNLSVAVFLLRKPFLLLFLVLPVLFYAISIGLLHTYQYKGFEFVNRTESRYGEILVLKLEDQFNVYTSKKFYFSYPETQTEELTSHLPMTLHPSPQRVLIVGGSPAVVRELLKYPVSRIDFVEIDPVLTDISKGLLEPADRTYLEDERVSLRYTDARRFIKLSPSASYDLIVLNIPEPSTANINRFYTVEFFREVLTSLDKKGILCLSLPVSYGYIGKRMQMANGSVYTSLRRVFPSVQVSSEEYGFFIASGTLLETDPELLAARFLSRGIETNYFRDYILYDAFSPLKLDMVSNRLGRVEEVNSDLRPVSYLYTLMLWTEIHGARWLSPVFGLGSSKTLLSAGFVMFFVTLLFSRKRQTIPYVMFTTGFFTMAYSLAIVLIYQGQSGYIYEMIGLLTGTFMLGSACGSFMMRDIRKPLRLLKVLDLLAILLLFLTARFPGEGLMFYGVILAAGLLGGGQFAAANLSLPGGGKGRTAGMLYAVDLTGSFLGSFLSAIFLIPLMGIQNTLLFLTGMKILSFLMLLKYKKP